MTEGVLLKARSPADRFPSRLTVLSVAYPFAPVSADAAGGAEQVLALLDHALTQAGHDSIVVAAEGSTVQGTLAPTPRVAGMIDEPARAAAWQEHRRAIMETLDRYPIDLVHMHGIDFDQYLPPPGPPVLVTLHLPPSWYSPGVFALDRPRTFLHCVSSSQQHACPPSRLLLPPIENGVPVESLRARVTKRDFAVSIGRICPEKGFHIALQAARRANVPLLLAGQVYPYEEHERYYREEILPRLDCSRRFIGPVGFERKRRLLSAARCLLVPSLAPETSSLVAMEALACGTPVIALPSGALADIVEHGKTGFLVNDANEMAEAIAMARSIDAETCRHAARKRFSAERMVAQYFARYQQLTSDGFSRERSPRQSRAL
jgi:glycosyltransferase involved in cell wall biosynthesis